MDSNNIQDSFLFKIKHYFEQINKTYLIISRPKNLTVFATLINFLNLNPNLKFVNVITNLGFVDMTPKKQNYIDDILSQIESFFNSSSMQIVKHEKYDLNDGTCELLGSIDYSDKYIEKIISLLNVRFEKCYFMSTPIIAENIKLNRERPKTFFKQLYETNKFLNKVVSLNQDKYLLVDIQDINYTFDGVHYTKKGHQQIFEKIKESIKI